MRKLPENGSRQMHAPSVNVITDGPDQFAHRAAPITLPRSATEIAAPVMHGGLDLVGVPGSVKGDMEEEVSQPAAEPDRPAQPRHELTFVGRLQKDVTRVELDHKQKLHSASRFEL
jgi:hypothetical protein